MKCHTNSKRVSLTDYIIESKAGILLVAIAGIILGIIFIVSQSDNKPIARSEAVFYSGNYDKYVVDHNYRAIIFTDGSSYALYPHTGTQSFNNQMKLLDNGTKLYILVNPNNDYVVEIKTETEELLNFNKSQEAIDSYDNGYIALGCFMCFAGVFLIAYVIAQSIYAKKENARHLNKSKKRINSRNDQAIRDADYSTKSKVLLEAKVHHYIICYRRIKSVNELVINDLVYDEKKGIIEFEHSLSAVIRGHTIEAGYDKNSYSYISFDGKRIAEKKRLI